MRKVASSLNVSLKIKEINMMRYSLLIGILILFHCTVILSATVNGRFTIVQINNYQFTTKMQINTNTGSDDLGGATIVFEYDTTSLAFPNNPVSTVDYTFHNFSGGNYSLATITRPMPNQIWVNIDLPFINNNNGTLVEASPFWTDVVTINFEVIDPNGMASLSWLTTSPFWGIYDADNSTLWQIGQFDNLFDPLPVELISFTAALLANNNVLLEWKTASSLNNAGFEVQKSYTKSEDWEAIGFVESYGDPNAVVEYSFTDVRTHKFPVVRYRLKSIDNDGSYEYSEIVEINTLPINYDLSQNYPNPFNPSTRIKFTIPALGEELSVPVQLKVYDVLGNEVMTLLDEQKQPGVYEIEMNTSNGEKELSSGIYIYRIFARDFVSSKKMILLK